MIRVMRSSAANLAAAYTGLGLLALALFAAPLWYAWKVTIEDGRVEILQADALRLTEVFRHDGADGLVTYIEARVRHARRRRTPAAADRRELQAARRQPAGLADERDR